MNAPALSDHSRAIALASLLILSNPLPAATPPPLVHLISIRHPDNPPSATGSSDSLPIAISPDGRFVAFISSGNNLVSPDANGDGLDVFVFDRVAKVTRLVSRSLDHSGGANGDSTGGAFSGHAEFLAFESYATDLVPIPSDGSSQVYVAQLETGILELISFNLDATHGGAGDSSLSALTPDARFVLFESDASDLVPNDRNNSTDLFLRDRVTSQTTLVTVDYRQLASATPSTPTGLPGLSSNGSLSRNGRFVAYQSDATNLVPQDNNNFTDVFVRDLELGTNILVSATPAGTVSRLGASRDPVLSADGRYVVFLSEARDLVPNVSTPQTLVLRRDLQTGTTLRLSPPISANSSLAAYPTLSEDGQRVAFLFPASNGSAQIYAWDAVSGLARIISQDAQGQLAAGLAEEPFLTPDGSTIVFLSNATNLVDAISPPPIQVLAHLLDAGTTRVVSAAGPDPSLSTSDCSFVLANSTGQIVAFGAPDNAFAPEDHNALMDTYARDLRTDQIELLSTRDPNSADRAATGNSQLSGPCFTYERPLLLFTSLAPNLTPDDGDPYADVFLHDLLPHTNGLVSAASPPTQVSSGYTPGASLAANSLFVAFTSTATNLTDLDTNLTADVYLRDLTRQSNTLVSLNRFGTAASGLVTSPEPVVSSDAKYVAFLSQANDLVAGDANNRDDLFLHHLETRTTYALTLQLPAGLPISTRDFEPLAITPGPRVFFLAKTTNVCLATDASPAQLVGTSSAPPAISPDGNTLVFHTFSRTESLLQIRHLETATTRELLRAPGTGFPRSRARLALTPDARYLAFTEAAPHLNPLDHNQTNDVFVLDLGSPTPLPRPPLLVSINRDGLAAGNGPSDLPEISRDGRFVLFRSSASDLVPNDHNSFPDIFLRDLHRGTTYLVSVDTSGHAPGNQASFDPRLHPEATFAAFLSFASNLVPGDFNERSDVFVFDLTAAISTDTDGDLMPDAWEQLQFGTLDRDGHGDADHDGMPDAAEFQCGTSPLNAASRLTVRLEWTGPTPVPVVFWNSAPTTRCQVQYRTSLTEGSWQNLPGTPQISGNELFLADASFNSASPARFYRVALLP